MKEAILSGKSITKTFGETIILHGIDIELYAGDFTVIMGSSGSGKSTLLYALSGMERPDSGQLFFRKQDIINASEKELTKLRAEDFGFVFQQTHLISNLTLDENIRMAGLIGPLSEKEVKIRTDALIKQMNLEGARDRLPSQTSGGEAQRAAVARAVINRPVILFADEPTGALNKANSEEVLNLLSSLHEEGQSVLLVTHDREAALRGNRILYLEDGAIIGELELPIYTGKDRPREEKLTAWLEGFEW
ncbi:MAG: ATP-binding cassette domain-containing protein [Lachnospiraceae bacterium]|nr:ATP-binding cassette domain-containing protein [Lachnospiraceae bacterium]